MLSKRNIFLIVLAVGLTCLLWWRVTWGGLIPDESLTWSQTARFLSGDSPFRHEWNLSLLSGIVLMPVDWLMRAVGMSHDGLLLFTRRAFVVFWIAFHVFLYCRWRRIHACGALIGVLALVMLPPRYVFAFSYNSIGFLGLLAAITIYATKRGESMADDVLTGVAYAIGVLGCPYLAVLYFCYLIYGLLHERRTLLGITIGCAIVTVVFLATLLCMVSAGDIIKAVPCMLMPHEEALGIHGMAWGMYLFKVFCRCFGHWALAIPFMSVVALAVADRNSMTRNSVYVVALASLALLGLGVYVIRENTNSLNMMMPILPLFAFACCVIHMRGRQGPLLLKIGIPIAAYCVTYGMASNTGRLAMATALGSGIVPGGVLLGLLWDESNRGELAISRKIFKCCVVALVAAYLVCAYLFAPARQYPNGAIRMEDGPLSGLMATQKFQGEERILFPDTEPIRSNDKVKNVLYYLRYHQWLYLCTDQLPAAYSVWLSTGKGVADKLAVYWQWNPDKLPDAVYVDFEHVADTCFDLDRFCQENGYWMEMLPSGRAICWRNGVKIKEETDR